MLISYSSVQKSMFTRVSRLFVTIDFMPDESYSHEGSGLMYSQYIFQFSFAATATTIVSGAVAMRLRFFIYCAYSIYAVVAYAFVAHWVWAENGWLRTMGVYDFAGGGPVHLLGGTSALIAVKFVGPRTGYFQRGNNRTQFAASSPASTLFGLFMLWWGWIGFNCGSTFGITGNRWIVATRTAMITINASSAGGAVSLLYTRWRTGGNQVRPHHLVNGILGALVSTSPTCAVIHSWQALIIGAIGAVLANLTNTLLKRLRVDDPVGAIGIHAGGAIWGYIAVGLFADGSLPGVNVMDGLFAGGGGKLLGLQLLAIVSIMAWALVTVTPFYYLVGVIKSKDWKDPRSGLRITKEHELVGEDKHLHGIEFPFDQSMYFGRASSTGSQSSGNGSEGSEERVGESTPNDDNNNEENPCLLSDVPISVSMADARQVSCLKGAHLESFKIEDYILDEEENVGSAADDYAENEEGGIAASRPGDINEDSGATLPLAAPKEDMPRRRSHHHRPRKGNSKSSSIGTLRSSATGISTGTGIMGFRFQTPVESVPPTAADVARAEEKARTKNNRRFRNSGIFP